MTVNGGRIGRLALQGSPPSPCGHGKPWETDFGRTKAATLLGMPRVPTVVPEPMLARLTDRLPIGPAWSYEVKWDGYRCLALKVGDAVTLRSRNASNLTAS